MKNHDLLDFTDPVAYSDNATDDAELLTVVTGKEAEHWVRWFVVPDFFKYWHWN